MNMALLAAAGPAGWVLLAVLAVALFTVLGVAGWVLAPWLRGGWYRPAHSGGPGVMSSLAPGPLGSMQLDDDLPAWEARREDPALWGPRLGQPGLEEFVRGGYRRPSHGPGGDPFATMPPDDPGPGFTSFVPRPGVPDVPEVVHDEYAGLPAGLPRTGCAGQPGPDAGPAAGHSPPIPAAGPVPWQNELSKQDADTLRWLADYTDRWKVAA